MTVQSSYIISWPTTYPFHIPVLAKSAQPGWTWKLVTDMYNLLLQLCMFMLCPHMLTIFLYLSSVTLWHHWKKNSIINHFLKILSNAYNQILTEAFSKLSKLNPESESMVSLVKGEKIMSGSTTEESFFQSNTFLSFLRFKSSYDC